ncbi:MAG TPA: hypothetical protein H9841_03790 [Candidatus Flavonifractor merdigallinarum]|uniref:Dipicolinate synthase subunit A N-terminal domain-containing protein n=1 Tax=Candidatus Flavonifractor merdigallinarum TaxID=2838589 RepID=A0A9D1Y7H5_9FIRM|nr:hypothetical protein [Candidatus Flavonifractor merdigallinarum]
MRHELNFWVVGGDQRQACLAGLLAADGHTVHTFALDGAGDLLGEAQATDSLKGLDLADCIVLPLPLLGEGEHINAPLASRPVALEEVLAATRPGQIVCAGRVEEPARSAILRRELVLRDYFAREELAVANAVPTVKAMGHQDRHVGRSSPIQWGQEVKFPCWNSGIASPCCGRYLRRV